MRPIEVLLIEDSATDAVLVRAMLGNLDAVERPTLTHALTLAEGLQRLGQRDYDVILLDMNLPDGQGVGNVEKLRAAQRRPAIVVLTGQDDDQSALAALRRGAQEYVVKGRADGEQLLRIMQHAIERHRVLAEVDHRREQEFIRASHDSLTGLANRALFSDRAREAIAQAERRGEKLALCFLDLDRFKPVNDTLGHAAGDALLTEVARLLRETLRDSDTAARVGGDEFALLLCPVRSAQEVDMVTSRVIERVRNIRLAEGRAVSVGGSMGIALYPDHGTSYEQLMLRADQAMYLAKSTAKGGAVMFNEAVPGQASGVDVSLLFQPWVDTRDGRYQGVEVFVRTAGAGADGLDAEEIVRRAERGRAVLALGLRVLEEACGVWTGWKAQGIAPGRLALNVSRAELNEAEFANRWLAVLERKSMLPCYLQLEVAEDAFQGNSAPLVSNLQRLRAQGARVMLDNFGRSQASLLQLARLPIDGIKLDKSLVQGLRDDGTASAVVSGLLDIAQPWALEVIAAGVETEEDYRRFRALDCRYQQGYWFAAPQSAASVAQMLSAPPVFAVSRAA